MTPIAATLYTLITVTYGGDVHHSREFETLHLCEEGRSLALTGKTLEQIAEDERQRHLAMTARDIREHQKSEMSGSWPESQLEWTNSGNLLTGYSGSPWGGGSISITQSGGGTVTNAWVQFAPIAIRFAECVIEPRADKAAAPR